MGARLGRWKLVLIMGLGRNPRLKQFLLACVGNNALKWRYGWAQEGAPVLGVPWLLTAAQASPLPRILV